MKMSKPKKIALISALVAVVVGGLTWHFVQEHDEDDHRPHTVVHHKLYRTRQPEPLVAEGLLRRKITKVVNLRPRDEDPAAFDAEQAACNRAGIRMINIPFTGVLPTDDQLLEFLRLAQKPDGATLVHCAQGRTRTGLMCAVYLVVVEGYTPQQAMVDLVEHRDQSNAQKLAEKMALFERLYRDRTQWLARVNAPATLPASAPAASAPTSASSAPAH